MIILGHVSCHRANSRLSIKSITIVILNWNYSGISKGAFVLIFTCFHENGKFYVLTTVRELCATQCVTKMEIILKGTLV